jgi:hypothetical protein
MTSKPPATLKGVVLPQWVRCGKANCRCASGKGADLHGPYYYRFWRERGRLRKKYVPQRDLEATRAACKRRQDQECRERMQRRKWESHYQSLMAELSRLSDSH